MKFHLMQIEEVSFSSSLIGWCRAKTSFMTFFYLYFIKEHLFKASNTMCRAHALHSSLETCDYWLLSSTESNACCSSLCTFSRQGQTLCSISVHITGLGQPACIDSVAFMSIVITYFLCSSHPQMHSKASIISSAERTFLFFFSNQCFCLHLCYMKIFNFSLTLNLCQKRRTAKKVSSWLTW